MSMDKKTTVDDINNVVKKFVDDRDWEQFHNPKDVALALSIEVAEVLEHFRWKSPDEVKEWLTNPNNKKELADEIGDCVYFLFDLARVSNIDIAKAFEEKIEKSAEKYPIELVKGKHHKYTYYQKKQE
ncbi:MAG: nucleotide pyrophosphohydrolase [Candidatus Woesearchaeota archaeon]